MIKKYLLSLIFIATSMLFSSCKTVQPKQINNTPYLLIGTYTQRSSEGIYVYQFDENTGNFSEIISKATNIKNPSFLAVSPNKKYVYSVEETTQGGIVAYSFSEGKLTELNRTASGGADPCHLTTDATGKWLFTGNYSGGNLSVIGIENNGIVTDYKQLIQHTGSGTNAQRQEKPHVHSVTISPTNKEVFVADLGTDKMVSYTLNTETGKLSPNQETSVSAGSGPRHFVFHPNGKFAYVIQELTGKVTVFSYKNGQLSFVEEVSTLPEGFTGKNSCADIQISSDGNFLYGSNRFYDTIVSFAVNNETGKLNQLEQQSVLGKVPRNFTLSPNGKYVLVANQESDNIVVFERNSKTGKLTPTGKELKISMPVCLKWL